MVYISIQKPTAKHGELSHVDRIPGGKRFWKVGRAYQLKANVYLFKDKIGHAPVLTKYHARQISDGLKLIAFKIIWQKRVPSLFCYVHPVIRPS